MGITKWLFTWQCKYWFQFKSFEPLTRFVWSLRIQHYICHTPTPACWDNRAVQGSAQEVALKVLRMLRNATLYIMKYSCICICLENFILFRLTIDFWPCQRSRSWPMFCRVGTLYLDSILVKSRRIYIHPFKSYKGNVQTDRQTDGTDIRIKCSLKSHLEIKSQLVRQEIGSLKFISLKLLKR